MDADNSMGFSLPFASESYILFVGGVCNSESQKCYQKLEGSAMLKTFRFILIFLLTFNFSATLIGNEWANYYFPDALGSYWVYEDQNGDELTRYAIEPEEIDGETYRAFSYEPALEDWANYEYYVHPYFYQIGDDWVAFFVGRDTENATKAVLTQQMEEGLAMARQMMAEQLPPGVTVDFSYTIETEAQDYFYLFPTPATFNEEWTAMQFNVVLTMKVEIQGTDLQIPGGEQVIPVSFAIVETGEVVGTETIETDAGTFEDCLKIEYQTETVMDTSLPIETLQPGMQQMDESFTTLWLAPNVGIVKFTHEHEQSDEVRILELTQYEIKSSSSEGE